MRSPLVSSSRDKNGKFTLADVYDITIWIIKTRPYDLHSPSSVIYTHLRKRSLCDSREFGDAVQRRGCWFSWFVKRVLGGYLRLSKQNVFTLRAVARGCWIPQRVCHTVNVFGDSDEAVLFSFSLDKHKSSWRTIPTPRINEKDVNHS